MERYINKLIHFFIKTTARIFKKSPRCILISFSHQTCMQAQLSLLKLFLFALAIQKLLSFFIFYFADAFTQIVTPLHVACKLFNPKTNNFRERYSEWPEETIIVNALAMVLVALAILVSFAVRSPTLSSDSKTYVTERL